MPFGPRQRPKRLLTGEPSGWIHALIASSSPAMPKIVNGWGFQRVGAAVVGLDEKIYPSFKRSDLTIATGWDIWSGHYLLSECATGDEFLRTLYSELQF
jgi:hypothetical protein